MTDSPQHSLPWRVSVGTLALPLIAALLGALIVGGARLHVAPVCRAIAWLSGREIWLDRQDVDVGTLPTPGAVDAAVTMRNYSGAPVVVMGAETTCRCTTAGGLPVTIAPSDRVDLPIRVQTASGQTQVAESVVFLVQSGGAVKRYRVRVHGACAPTPENAAPAAS